jgi:cell division protein FtsZ
MSMSEIQEAAEIITSAVSPDANIIFGATLKADIEDELIITVIATGFDTAYFHEEAEVQNTQVSDQMGKAIDSTEVKDIDMNLDHSESAAIFAEENTENMWNQATPEEDDESDTPAFLRRRKKREKKNKE